MHRKIGALEAGTLLTSRTPDRRALTPLLDRVVGRFPSNGGTIKDQSGRVRRSPLEVDGHHVEAALGHLRSYACAQRVMLHRQFRLRLVHRAESRAEILGAGPGDQPRPY